MVDLLLTVLIVPLGVLAHELGHAAVALLLTDGPVKVLVGRQPGILRLRIGRLALSLHAEPAQDTGWSGVCAYKPTGRPRDALMIIAAGPIASLMWAVACAAGFVVWGHQLHWPGLVMLGLGTIEGVIAFVYNGAAALVPSLMTARPESDGAKFRHVLGARPTLRQIERDLGRPITRAELEQVVGTKEPRPQQGRKSVPRTSTPTRPASRVSWTVGRAAGTRRR